MTILRRLPTDVREWSDHEITSHLTTRSDNDLGKLFRSYLTDSIHNNWDGHPTTDRVAYYELFADMIRFHMQECS